MTTIARIAMWSGPRNISTAMMRAWENRSDCAVRDEPLYAYYLRETGLEHPGRDEVLASQDNDWRKVIAQLCGEVPEGSAVFYHKHMAHHLCGDISLEWLGSFRHAFLVREPRAMLASLARVLPRVRLEDTGLPQQLWLYKELRAGGEEPPVLDSKDVLDNPEFALRALCASLDVPFDSAMLSWPAGPRASDGVWAPYWYDSVIASTGFLPYRERQVSLTADVADLYEPCREIYDQLYARRLKDS